MKLITHALLQALACVKLNILLASSQVRHLFGSGGLGDVAVALANATNGRGLAKVRLVMPGWGAIKSQPYVGKNLVLTLQVPYGDDHLKVEVYEVTVPQSATSPVLTCYLFHCPEVFGSADPAGRNAVKLDLAEQAIVLSRATVLFARHFASFTPDVIHCNDWHTGLVSVYLDTIYRDDPVLRKIATIFTSHNAGLGFQGSFSDSRRLLELSGLQGRDVFTPGVTRSLEHNGYFNFAKGGIGFSDIVTTVSATYARQLRWPKFSGGLNGVFAARGSNFVGLINGVDKHEWNPDADQHLPLRFSANDPVSRLMERKRQLRSVLRKWVVPDQYPNRGARPFAALRDDTIMIGSISRIDFQKIPILFRAVNRIVAEREVQLCLLGDAHPDDKLGQEYARRLEEMVKNLGGKFMFFRGYDDPLSHLIYASGQLSLVASIYEPCGLTQIISATYGSVPIVRNTGGLGDTITDEKDPTPGSVATGFVFLEELPEGEMIDDRKAEDDLIAAVKAADELVLTVQRALEVFRGRPDRWAELVKNGMTRDWSWEVPSMQYWLLYLEAVWRTRLAV